LVLKDERTQELTSLRTPLQANPAPFQVGLSAMHKARRSSVSKLKDEADITHNG
jgi:hypothetical protein